MTDCLFCKIASGEIDADIVYETDSIVGFRDINPQAPTHILIIPREHIESVAALEEADLDIAGQLLLAARDVARQEGISDGFRVIANAGERAGQSVFHIHLHVLGGRTMGWPPG